MSDLRRVTSFAAALVFFVAGVTGCSGSSVNQPATSPTTATSAGVPDDGLDAMTDEQLVRKLLEATGAATLGKQVGDSMLDTFKKMPNLPPGFLEKFKENLNAEDLIELIVPIYRKHYEHKTLIAAIRFYQSDAGRAIVKTLPAITAESMEVGKLWGTSLAKKTLRQLGKPAD
jgi:hypothetical protein